MNSLTLIVAATEKNIIGSNGTIPWRQTAEDRAFYKKDMQRFKRLTMGNAVLMGRKTWDSLGEKYQPLPGRTNIIVTRDSGFSIKNNSQDKIIVANSIGEALFYGGNSIGKFYPDIFVIGGQQIYEQTIGIADVIELTRIHKEFEGDAFFPEINTNIWRVVNVEDRPGYSFISYRRK